MKKKQGKIVSLGKFYYPTKGGVEKVTKDIAEIVAGLGFESKVIAFDGVQEKVEYINGVTIKRYKKFKIGPAPISIKFLKEADRLFNESDLLIAHYPNPIVETAILRNPSKKPLILFYHSDLVGYNKIITNLYNNHTRKLLERSDIIISTSPNYMDNSKILSKFKSKVKIIPLVINPTEFQTNNEYNFDKLKYQKKVLFVGRFVKYKGVEFLIKALKYLDKDVELILAGGGERYKKYKKLIKKEKLEGKVHFIINPTDEILKSIYKAVDVFVLPSIMRSEAFGIVSLEAMYNELPIVTTELGTGTSFYNIPYQTGMIVQPKNEKQIAEAIVMCLKNKDKWGKKAKEVVESKFTFDTFKKEISEVIENLLFRTKSNN